MEDKYVCPKCKGRVRFTRRFTGWESGTLDPISGDKDTFDALGVEEFHDVVYRCGGVSLCDWTSDESWHHKITNALEEETEEVLIEKEFPHLVRLFGSEPDQI
jgi:hypothetical protein